MGATPGWTIELKTRGPEDPDGRRVEAVLAAYVHAQQACRFRQLLWRRLAIGALGVGTIATTTSILPRNSLVLALLALGATAVFGAVVEWRARRSLRELVDK